ncbi:MAG: LysM peptidoglycan-binding domain-containing protein [Panacagrimonas sp.]
MANYRRTCNDLTRLRSALLRGVAATLLAVCAPLFGQSVDASVGEELKVQKLSPEIRELPLQISIPTIPIDTIRNFLRGPRLVSSEELAAAPYVLAFADDHLVGGAGGDVYVQDLVRGNAINYAVVRRGESYKDPDSGELLGYEAIPVGEAEVKDYGSPGIVVLSKTSRETLVGDRLIAAEPEAFSENFFPREPAQSVDGKIMTVTDGFARIGQYHVVAINRGSQHGLEPGHVLDILHAGRSTSDLHKTGRVALPEVHTGQLIVFKVSPRLSYGLVMSATQPIFRLDKVRTPALGRP